MVYRSNLGAAAQQDAKGKSRDVISTFVPHLHDQRISEGFGSGAIL